MMSWYRAVNYKDYVDQIAEAPDAEDLEYTFAVIWLHPDILPVKVVSGEEAQKSVVKIPSMVTNRYGRKVPVIAIGSRAFEGNENITDLVIPPSVTEIGAGAFAGCKNLKNITLPMGIKRIEEGTFAGCDSMENVYYEGTLEDWKKVDIVHSRHEIEFGDLIPGTPVYSVKAEREIHIPGNDALLCCNIHFRCEPISKTVKSKFRVSAGGRDITDMFRTKL